MITVHFYFQAKTACVQTWQTQTPQSATVTKETRTQLQIIRSSTTDVKMCANQKMRPVIPERVLRAPNNNVYSNNPRTGGDKKECIQKGTLLYD
jgi:hypothetical protein